MSRSSGSGGWSEQTSMNLGGQTMLVYEKDGRIANIALMPLEGKTSITVNVAAE